MGSTSPSTWVMSGSSKVRQRWNMASQALIWLRKAFPRPCPSLAPFTKPAISVTFKKAGTLLAGLWCLTRKSKRGSGTGTLLSLGSIVQNGKFSAAAIDVLVRTLKNVDFPTFGKPTIPHFRFVLRRPMMAGRCSSSCPFFFGGILRRQFFLLFLVLIGEKSFE